MKCIGARLLLQYSKLMVNKNMKLKELMMSLAGKPKPNPTQLVWLANCPEKVGNDFAGA